MPLVPDPGPLRVLASATPVNTFGNGLMFTISALYFTRTIVGWAQRTRLRWTGAAGDVTEPTATAT